MATKTKEKPAKLHVRKGDKVFVISGKNKDRKTAKEVIRVLPSTGKVVVEGVNVMKDTPNKRRAQGGAAEEGITEKAMPIDVSNVMLVDPKTNTPTRIRLVKSEDGKRVRVSVKSGAQI